MTVIVSDARAALLGIHAEFDAVVTDPPYELGGGLPYELIGAAPTDAANARWDRTGVAFSMSFWRQVLQAAKPGAYLVAFGATRTYHRLAVAVEEAGWEIRECLMWVYANGAPHSVDIGAAVDREVGGEPLTVERKWVRNAHRGGPKKRLRVTTPGSPEGQQWAGWGTGLRPAWEPILLARKALDGTVVSNVMTHGTGALKVSERVGGRWPSNIVATDEGFMGRFDPIFVIPKAKGAKRGGSDHPTVKPVELMAHLLRLVVPPGGKVLDPFGGSGSTGVAAILLGMQPTLIEVDPAYAAQARERMEATVP